MKKKMSKKAGLFFNKTGNRVFILISVLFLAVFFFFITLSNVHMETYDAERFTNARDSIRSPVTIENEQATERQTRETVQAVEDRYNISEEITEERIKYVAEIFEAISKLEEESLRPAGDSEENQAAVPISNREKVQQLKEILSTEITDVVNDSVFIQLVEIPENEREEGQELFISLLEDTMQDGVRTENIQSAKSTMKQSINYAELTPELKNELTKLTEFAIVENSFFDMEKTMEARRNAASSVDPVVIRAGETIVHEGQTITNEIYEELTLVGAMDNDRNLYPLIGLAMLLLIISFIAAHEMYWLSKKKKMDRKKVIAILIISVLVVSIMKVVSLYTTGANNLFFAVPVATGVLLIKQLIHERTAIVYSGIYAILGSIIFNGQIPGSLNVEAGIYFFLAQLAGIIFLMNVKDRLSILRSGIGMTVINILTVLLFLFLSIERYAITDILIQSSFGLASAFLSAVLMIGLLPFFETGLGILTDIKLLQLASPNQPLLKKLLTEAPGTYHHSVMVANLSETACEAVGANGLLARVGAYYHDIGKTVRPHYFIENQLSINNPHDVISPKQSAEIIISHPYDGADMLKKHRLPEEIIDIAKQHHGTTLLKYFYYKEKETNKHVKEENYRYPGPKPQTKEAAIVCICDSVEAAVRSLKEPTEQKIEEIVSSIVKDRMTDGQLSETPLTLHELDVVQRTVCNTLKGIFHSRIQYPIKEAK
ncbi:HD family phosphohydrolase [Virgibacillus oceani]